MQNTLSKSSQIICALVENFGIVMNICWGFQDFLFYLAKRFWLLLNSRNLISQRFFARAMYIKHSNIPVLLRYRETATVKTVTYTDSTMSHSHENLKMFNISSKYFNFFNNTRPANCVAHVARDFFTLSCSYYSFMLASTVTLELNTHRLIKLVNHLHEIILRMSDWTEQVNVILWFSIFDVKFSIFYECLQMKFLLGVVVKVI